MSISQKKAGVILSYGQIVLRVVLSLVITPIILRKLGQSEYGLFQLASSIIVYLSAFGMSFTSAYVKYYSEYEARQEQKKICQLNGFYLVLFTGLSIAAFAVGVVIAQNAGLVFQKSLSYDELSKFKILMILMLFDLADTFIFNIFNMNITVHEQFMFQKLLMIIKTIMEQIATVAVLIIGYRAVGMMATTCVLSLIFNVINAVYCRKKLDIQFQFRGIDFNMAKNVSKFTIFILLSVIVDQINWTVDKTILGIFHGTTQISIYSVGFQFNSYFLTFGTAISAVFIPEVNRIVNRSNSNAELTDEMIKIGRVQFQILFFILCAFFTFGEYFITIWAGEDYRASYLIAILLMTPVIVPAIQNIGIEIQKAKNMHMFRSVTYALIAVGNLLISIPLCKRYAGLGCVIGTALSIVFGNIIAMNIYYEKRIGLDIKRFWKNIINMWRPCGITATAGIAMQLYGFSNILTFGLGIVLFIVIYCTSMWKFGLNTDEKLYYGSVLGHLGLKRAK